MSLPARKLATQSIVFKVSLRSNSGLQASAASTDRTRQNVARRLSTVAKSNKNHNFRNASSIVGGYVLSTQHRAGGCGRHSKRGFSWWPWSTSSSLPPNPDPKAVEATKSSAEPVVLTQPQADAEDLQRSLPPGPIDKATSSSVGPVDPTITATPPEVPIVSTASSVNPSASAIDSSTLPPVEIPPLSPGALSSLGLTSYWPAGLLTSLLEYTHIYITPLFAPLFPTTSWIPTFFAFNLITRLFILPFAISGARASAKLAKIAPQLSTITSQAKEAQMRGDVMALQMIRLKQRDMMQKSGVKISSVILPGLIQATMQLAAFVAIRRLCVLPLPQLKIGGIDFASVAWIQDLTIPDPYYVLPIVNTVMMNAQLMLSVRDMASNPNPNSPHVLNLFRVLSLLGAFFLITFPAGLNLHLCFSITFFILQTVFLRVPSVRKLLKLPSLPAVPKGWKMPSVLDSFRYAKDGYRNQVIQQQKLYENRRREMTRMSGRTGG